MKYIFIDFEMNIVSRDLFEELTPCHMEIIEIGAVALDENFVEISSYNQFIKPQYNEHIMPRYTAMTGITDETVENSPNFEECYYNFLDWCNSFGIDNYKIFAWSGSDLKQLVRELNSKNIDISQPRTEYLISNWFDYQKEFTKQVGLKHVISLEKAVALIDYDYYRDVHSALCDARNTSIIYAYTQSNQNLDDLIELVSIAKDAIETDDENQDKNEDKNNI